MPLRLSPEHEAQYLQACSELSAARRVAEIAGDHHAAKKCRQAQNTLYQAFQKVELPPDPPTEWEIEMAMTLEQRVERIEHHLKIGKYSE
jgi:hypothetical protein